MEKKKISPAIFALAFTLCIAASYNVHAQMDARAIVELKGQTKRVCGKVDQARFAENSDGQPTFLYFGGRFPRHQFAVRVPGDVRAKFTPAPESFQGSNVCAEGLIEVNNGRPEIVVTEPTKLKSA